MKRLLAVFLSISLFAVQIPATVMADTGDATLSQTVSYGSDDEITVTVDISDECYQFGGFPDSVMDLAGASWDTEAAEATVLSGLRAKLEKIDLSSYKIPSDEVFRFYISIVNRHP